MVTRRVTARRLNLIKEDLENTIGPNRRFIARVTVGVEMRRMGRFRVRAVSRVRASAMSRVRVRARSVSELGLAP